VTAAFEGWYENDDGSFSLLVGYFNRNTKEVLDIPIGPNNRIEPGGPDQGQPTHFLPRRQWGVFAIRVPKDFGDKRLTWTITANGQTTSIPIGLVKDYQIEPFKDQAMGNTPPTVKFQPKGPEHVGPPRGFAATLTGTVGSPVTLTAWAADHSGNEEGDSPARFNAPPLRVSFSKYRGPGDVTFANAAPAVDIKNEGRAETTATFSAPGEYWIRTQVNDRTGDGGGGFQCCWTNAYVKVTISGGTAK
jgi:hypothetical protein